MRYERWSDWLPELAVGLLFVVLALFVVLISTALSMECTGLQYDRNGEVIAPRTCEIAR